MLDLFSIVIPVKNKLGYAPDSNAFADSATAYKNSILRRGLPALSQSFASFVYLQRVYRVWASD
jgi:hypothetical protein